MPQIPGRATAGRGAGICQLRALPEEGTNERRPRAALRCLGSPSRVSLPSMIVVDTFPPHPRRHPGTSRASPRGLRRPRRTLGQRKAEDGPRGACLTPQQQRQHPNIQRSTLMALRRGASEPASPHPHACPRSRPSPREKPGRRRGGGEGGEAKAPRRVRSLAAHARLGRQARGSRIQSPCPHAPKPRTSHLWPLGSGLEPQASRFGFTLRTSPCCKLLTVGDAA